MIKPSRSERPDPTKSRWYAYPSLAAQILTAIAAVLLGVAGLRFQQATEQRHTDDARAAAQQAAAAKLQTDKETSQKEREKRNLAAYQTLMELSVALAEADRNGNWQLATQYTQPALYAPILHLLAMGGSIPDSGDDLVSIRQLTSESDPKKVQLQLLPAIAMLADLLAESANPAPKSVFIEDGVARMTKDTTAGWPIDYDSRVADSFQVWMKTAREPVEIKDVHNLLRNLSDEVGGLLQKMNAKSELAFLTDQFVKIRTDALTSQYRLIPEPAK